MGFSRAVGICWGKGHLVKIFTTKNNCQTNVLQHLVHQKNYGFIVFVPKNCGCGLICMLNVMWKQWMLNAESLYPIYSAGQLFSMLELGYGPITSPISNQILHEQLMNHLNILFRTFLATSIIIIMSMSHRCEVTSFLGRLMYTERKQIPKGNNRLTLEECEGKQL